MCPASMMCCTRSLLKGLCLYMYDSRPLSSSRMPQLVIGGHESEFFVDQARLGAEYPAFLARLFPPESKARIRERCLTFLDEPDDIVSVDCSLAP